MAIMGLLDKEFIFEIISVAKWPVIFVLADKFILRKIKIPAEVDEKNVPKYQNELVSLFHDILTGKDLTAVS